MDKTKEAFLQSHKSNHLFYKRFFCLVEPLEREQNLDFTLMPTDMIQPLFDEVAGIRYRSMESRRLDLKQYVRWRRLQGMEVSDSVDDLSLDNLSGLRAALVSGPGHLQEIMDTVFHPVSEETVHLTYRGYLWMIYAGMKDEEIAVTSRKDFHKSLTLIRTPGNDFAVYSPAYETFIKLRQLDEFCYNHRNYSTFRKRKTNQLLSGNSDLNLTYINTVISKLSEEADVKALSRTYVYLSGVFNIMHDLEINGLPLNLSEIIARDLAMKNITARKRTDWERDYIRDYKRWKKAFEIE